MGITNHRLFANNCMDITPQDLFPTVHLVLKGSLFRGSGPSGSCLVGKTPRD